MTADIDLLPLPEAEYSLSPYGEPCLYDSEQLADYARANVAHATAAKDAEIEALRVRADAMAGEAIKHEARAERLADALRDAAEALQVAGLPGNAKLFRSMLREHEQEKQNEQ